MRTNWPRESSAGRNAANRSPSTSVPLVEFRSSIRIRPSTIRHLRCRRDTLRSSMLTWHNSGALPITTPSDDRSRCIGRAMRGDPSSGTSDPIVWLAGMKPDPCPPASLLESDGCVFSFSESEVAVSRLAARPCAQECKCDCEEHDQRRYEARSVQWRVGPILSRLRLGLWARGRGNCGCPWRNWILP